MTATNRRCRSCGYERPIETFRGLKNGRRTICRSCEQGGGMPASDPQGVASLLATISDMYERDRRLTQENAELRLMLKRERRRSA